MNQVVSSCFQLFEVIAKCSHEPTKLGRTIINAGCLDTAMLAHMLQGNNIHYPAYLFLFLCSFLYLFLLRAAHATPTNSKTLLGILTPGFLAGSILSLTKNKVFKDLGLFCCYYDPLDLLCLLLHALWPTLLFIPQAVQLLIDWCWCCWGKKARLLQTYFWLQHKSHPVCLFCWITICRALLRFGQRHFVTAHWKTCRCKHSATNEYNRCQCFTVWTIKNARP